MAIARETSNFQKICRKTESVIATSKAKLRIMANLQEQAFKSIAPYYTLSESIGEVLKRVMPLSSFVGGFPFSSSGYNDGTGYYFGRDSTGGLVVLDPWKRGNDRTNTNFTIMGVAGVGKSATIKHIALAEYMKGTKIIFIDPEREMRDLCLALDGDWINAGGGSNGKINPLQIRPTPVDDEDQYYKDEGNGMGDMAIYMKTLEIFFSLYLPSLSDKHEAILKNTLIELYNNFNITWETDIDQLSNDDFPVFLDLYQLLKEKTSAKDSSVKEKSEYDELALLLQDIALGGDAFLWNGKSTIKTNTRCICLDTHELQNTSDNIKRTQYFNILTWSWEQMSLDRTEPVLLICDEAYLMINSNVPQSLVFFNAGLSKESIKSTIGHGTSAQWNLSTSIPVSSVVAGDLAFLAIPGTRKVNHIGIVSGKNDKGQILVVHCSSGANNVSISTAESVGFLYYRRPAVLIK